MKYSPKNHGKLLKTLKRYFAEQLTTEEEIQFFQDLVDTGLFCQLGEHIKMQADVLLLEGDIKPPASGYRGFPPNVTLLMSKQPYIN